MSLRAKTQKSNHGLTLKWSLWDWRESSVQLSITSPGDIQPSLASWSIWYTNLQAGKTSIYKNKNKSLRYSLQEQIR